MHPFILLQENIKKKTKNHDNKHIDYHRCHNLIAIIIKENKQQWQLWCSSSLLQGIYNNNKNKMIMTSHNFLLCGTCVF